MNFLPSLRLSLIGYLFLAGFVGTIGTLTYQGITRPAGSAVFPVEADSAPA